MCLRRAAICVTAALAMVAWLAPTARADEWNKKTYLTFSGPVQIPGVTLAPGTYSFELADPDLARHIIRVSSQDGTKVLGMFMTIPAERMQPPDSNVIMFAERAAGAPPAIQEWFYPGDANGEEFVYPRAQAMAIAKANHREVLASEGTAPAGTEAERLAAVRGSKITRVDESGKTTNVQPNRSATTTAENRRPSTAASPASSSKAQSKAAQSTTAQSTTAAPSNTATGSRQAVGTAGRATTLPATASRLPLVELLSGLLIMAAFGVRLIRRRLADARA